MAMRVRFPGGSRRSEQMPEFHLIPPDATRRIARRFSLGTAIYGEDNWKKSLSTRKTAVPFLKDAYNHMIEHSMKMVEGADPEDDHLAAIGWAVAVLAYAERKFACRWTEL